MMSMRIVLSGFGILNAKDGFAMNLDRDLVSIMRHCPVCWLAVGML